MGILKDQSVRLLRQKWRDAETLAEEIYAILNTDEPIKIDSPVQIANNTPLPALTITNGGLGDQAFQYNRTPSPISFPGLPEVGGSGDIPALPGSAGIPGLPGSGGVNFGGTSQITLGSDGVPQIATGEAGQPLGDPSPASGAGGGGGTVAVPGLVVSGGPGDTYQVEVFGLGPTQPDGTEQDVDTGRVVTARQLQIDPGATIPPGTAVFVFLIGNTAGGPQYRMQVPVWL